jgi:site-specific recombinase XerD
MEPMNPRDAVEAYLADRKHELAASSHKNHRSRLDPFVEWCDANDITNMNDVSGKHLHQFKQYRAQDLAQVSLNYQLGTFRLFLRFCERLDVAPEGIAERVSMPTVDEQDFVSDQIVREEEAEKILEYAETYEYATFRHTTFHLLWHSGMRISAAQGLDLEDYHREDRYLDVTNRPTTQLKNRERGERQVNINRDLCRVLDDYIDTNHPMVEDDEGRMPLLGSRFGRPHKTTLSANVYRLTRPCHYTNTCPHDRALEDCEAAENKQAAKCPSSVASHAVRRGSITAHRKADIPKDIASDRMDVSGEVLEKHYDGRTEAERRRQRREYLNDIH